MDTSISPTSTKQPDRQTKLVCPKCGGIARMSNMALRLSGAIRCDGDGGTFAAAPHRRYAPRRTAEELAEAEREALAARAERLARQTADVEAKRAELAATAA